MRHPIKVKPTPEDWKLALYGPEGEDDNERLLDQYVARILPKLDQSIFDADTLKSYGWEGLLRAAQRWDPARGRFSTLASFCVRGAISEGIREELRQRGAGKPTGEILRGLFEDDPALAIEDPGDPEPEEPDYDNLYAAIAALPLLERLIVNLKFFSLEPHSNREIAKLLDLHPEQVRRTLDTGLGKLRALLEEIA